MTFKKLDLAELKHTGPVGVELTVGPLSDSLHLSLSSGDPICHLALGSLIWRGHIVRSSCFRGVCREEDSSRKEASQVALLLFTLLSLLPNLQTEEHS